MSDYSPWRALAQLGDVQLRFEDLVDDLGYWDPDSRTIVLDRNQTQAERRCTLAHELEHVARGDENITHVSPVLAARQEIAACTRAARRLIPLEALISALLWSQDERELAEVLNVDEDTIRVRLLTLTPGEHSVIDERLWDAEGQIA